MQVTPQLATCLVLADTGRGLNVRRTTGMSTHPLPTQAGMFKKLPSCTRRGDALMMASWRDFKKWKADSRKFDRKK